MRAFVFLLFFIFFYRCATALQRATCSRKPSKKARKDPAVNSKKKARQGGSRTHARKEADLDLLTLNNTMGGFERKVFRQTEADFVHATPRRLLHGSGSKAAATFGSPHDVYIVPSFTA